jgi:F0F1-type ATP synthase epsilon subunit
MHAISGGVLSVLETNGINVWQANNKKKEREASQNKPRKSKHSKQEQEARSSQAKEKAGTMRRTRMQASMMFTCL